MDRNCKVRPEMGAWTRSYDLDNGENIRVTETLVGLRVYAVIDADKYAKLTVNQEENFLRVDGKAIYFEASDTREGKKRLLFRERYNAIKQILLAMHTVLKLSPEHCRSKAV